MFIKILLSLLLVINILFINPTSAFAITLENRINSYPQWNSKLNLPQPDRDLIFPDWFEGKWEVSNILKEQIAPLAPRFKTPGFDQNEAYIDREILFDVQYIPTIEIPKQENFLPSIVNKKPIIIADRAFNGKSIAQAYLGKENVDKVIINSRNSTEQITNFSSENQLISTIVGRQQQTINDNKIITSEITRQFFRRPQSVYLNFVESTTEYELINPQLIKGRQISAIYLSPEDPDYFLAIDKPVALYYYELMLTKIN